MGRSGRPGSEPHEDCRGEHSGEAEQDRSSGDGFERRENKGKSHDLGERNDVGSKDELGKRGYARGRRNEEGGSGEESSRQNPEQDIAHLHQSRWKGG